MIFLIYSFLICFGITFPFFFVWNNFNLLRILITYFQLIFNPFLLYFILFEIEKLPIEELYSLNFNPLINITVSNNENSSSINFEYFDYGNYSLIEKGDFNKECLTNFYIKNSYECPITDIIILKNKSLNIKDYTKLKIENDNYLYFTNKDKIGRLYMESNFHYDNKNNFLVYDSNKNSYAAFIEKKKERDLKMNNPYINYYYYIKNGYLVTSLLLFFLYFYNCFQFQNPRKFGLFKIASYLLDIILLILFLIGFIFLLKIKQFKQKEIIDIIAGPKIDLSFYKIPFYKNKFTFEGIMISLQLVKIIMEILFLIFPKECHCFNSCFCFEDNDMEKNSTIFLFFVPIFITYIIFKPLNIKFDYDSKKLYDHLIYNWKTSPIFSIEKSSNKDYEIGKITTKKEELKIYEWRNTFFKIGRLNDFDYTNIYKKENGKLCGKDTFGNNLYFPEDIECPINEIIITNNENLEGYNKLLLGDSQTYLYYTNTKIENEIIIDIRASGKKGIIELNLDKTNDLCYNLENYEEECKDYQKFNVSKFYEKIDESYSFYLIDEHLKKKTNGLVYLNTISYLGINSYYIPKRGKISGFEKNMIIFNNNIAFKIISIAINILGIVIISIFLLIEKNKKGHFLINMILLVLILCTIIIYYVSLNININYIQNFMYLIDINFQQLKIEYHFSRIMLIYELLIFFGLLIFTITTFWFKRDSIFKCREVEIQNRAVIGQNQNEQISNGINSINLNHRRISNNLNEQKNNFNITNERLILNFSKKKNNNNNNNNNNNQHFCIICITKESTVILYPCRHRCYCKDCYARMGRKERKRCPMCRRRVIDHIDTIYDS